MLTMHSDISLQGASPTGLAVSLLECDVQEREVFPLLLRKYSFRLMTQETRMTCAVGALVPQWLSLTNLKSLGPTARKRDLGITFCKPFTWKFTSKRLSVVGEI